MNLSSNPFILLIKQSKTKDIQFKLYMTKNGIKYAHFRNLNQQIFVSKVIWLS